MNINVRASFKRYLAQAALLAICLSPLVGLGNIIARNRSIENAGRMQQGRLDALSGVWWGSQHRISAANEMLAASRINAATAMSEASKAMATKDVAKKLAEVERLLKAADEIVLRMDKQVAGFIPPKHNGWQNVLGMMLAMGLSAIAWGWARAADAASSRINPVVGILSVGVSLALASLAFGQSPVAPNTERVAPLQPGGILGEQLGVYRTIEGSLSEGIKVETGTLLVDTVDGKKLDKPIPLVIRSAVIVNHNLQPAMLSLPPKQRCILKGFESGEMIGVPPAVSIAAKEQGWKDLPMSPVHWQWRPHFVALVVVEPKGLEIREPSGAVAQRAQPKPVDIPANGANPKSEVPMLNKLPYPSRDSDQKMK